MYFYIFPTISKGYTFVWNSTDDILWLVLILGPESCTSGYITQHDDKIEFGC